MKSGATNRTTCLKNWLLITVQLLQKLEDLFGLAQR